MPQSRPDKEYNALVADADARGVLNYYNINRGPQIPYHERGWEGWQEMSKADRCNVDIGSLLELNIVPKRLADRYSLGDVDPETMDVSADSLAEHQEATHRPIPMALKTETHRDVRSFRSKRR